MRRIHTAAFLGLALLLVMALAACGDSGSDSKSPASTTVANATLGAKCTTPGARSTTSSGEPVVCSQGPGGGPNQWISSGATPPTTAAPTTSATTPSNPTLGTTCTTPGARSTTASGEPVVCGQGPGGGPNQWISSGTTPPATTPTTPPTTAATAPSNTAVNGASCTTQGATAVDRTDNSALVCGPPPGGGGLIWHDR